LKPDCTPTLEKVIQIDEAKIHSHLGEIVWGTVEETLNAMLDAEADQLCNAKRYERTEARKDTRCGALRTFSADNGRRSDLKGSQASRAHVPNGDHRAVPPAGELRGRGADRDVPGRRLGAASGGHHGGAVGNSGQSERGQRSEPADLRDDRSVA